METKKKEYGMCPRCGCAVTDGRWSRFACSGRCGISFKHYGQELYPEEMEDVLAGKEVLLENCCSKKGNHYDLLIWMDKEAPVKTYERKDGTEGYALNYASRFPDRPFDYRRVRPPRYKKPPKRVWEK